MKRKRYDCDKDKHGITNSDIFTVHSDNVLGKLDRDKRTLAHGDPHFGDLGKASE